MTTVPEATMRVDLKKKVRVFLSFESGKDAQSVRVPTVSTTEIARLYFDRKLSPKEIAKKLGISDQTVRTRLEKAGYTLRSHKEAAALEGNKLRIRFSEEHIQRICKRYCQDKLSVKNIASQFNVSIVILRRTLKAQGIRLRTSLQVQSLEQKRELQRYEKRISKNAGPKLQKSEVSEAKIVQMRTQENLTINEIAVKCSLSTVEVYEILKKAGVQ